MGLLLGLMVSMNRDVSYAKLRAFNDLVRFVGMSSSPFLFHVELEGKHVYFVQMMSFGGGRMIYYAALDKRISERYVVFNRFRDEISFSDQFSSSGQSTPIPIFELETTNLFAEFPPE
jgi:hypothetical protein